MDDHGRDTPMERDTTGEDSGNTSGNARGRRTLGSPGTNIGRRAESVGRRQYEESDWSLTAEDLGLPWRPQRSTGPRQEHRETTRALPGRSGLGRAVETSPSAWSQPVFIGPRRRPGVMRGTLPVIRNTSNQGNVFSGWSRSPAITTLSGRGAYAGEWHRHQVMTSSRTVNVGTPSSSHRRGMEGSQGSNSMSRVEGETGGWRPTPWVTLPSTSTGNFEIGHWVPVRGERSLTRSGNTVGSQQQRSDPFLGHGNFPGGVQSYQGERRSNRVLVTTRGTLINKGGSTRHHGYTRLGEQNPLGVPDPTQEDRIRPGDRTAIGGLNQSEGTDSTPYRYHFHTNLEQTMWERGNRNQAGGMGSGPGDEARGMECKEHRTESTDSAEVCPSEEIDLTNEDAVRTNAGDRGDGRASGSDEARGTVEMSQQEEMETTNEYVAATADIPNVGDSGALKRSMSESEATGIPWKKYRRTESIDSGELSGDGEMELTPEEIIDSGETSSAGASDRGDVSVQGDEASDMQWTEYRRTDSIDSFTQDERTRSSTEGLLDAGYSPEAGDGAEAGGSNQ